MKNLDRTDAFALMSRPVRTLSLRSSVREAAQLFLDAGVSAVVIEDGDRPVGVITKTDLARYEAARDGVVDIHGVRPEDLDLPSGFQALDEDERVERWMTPATFMVARHTPVRLLARQMVKYGTHHILVKGPDQRVEGIVSSFDVLRCLAFGAEPAERVT